MKSPFAIIIISILIIGFNNSESYSINTFLNHIQETGLYDVLVEVKRKLSDDISISFCIELEHTNLCVEVVRVYMQRHFVSRLLTEKRTVSRKEIKMENLMRILQSVETIDKEKFIEAIDDKDTKIKELQKKLESIVLSEKFYPIVTKYMPEEEIRKICLKIAIEYYEKVKN